MKIKLLLFLLIFSASIGFCGDLGESYLDANGLQVYVSHAKPLPTISTISVSLSIPATQTINVSTGLLGTFSLSIPLSTPVALPSAPAGATKCQIMPTQDVNWGGSTLSSGTAEPYFFQAIPGQGFFGFSDFTSLRLIGRTAVATATGRWY